MGAWVQKATSKGGEFEKPPVGNHPAVLVAIIDMGCQEQEYQGNVTYPHRAFFVWELVTEKMSGTTGRNHLIGIDLTVSLNLKAKLRQWIEARVGKQMPEDAEYDIAKELGKPCLLDVIANKKGYSVVNGMKGVPKGLVVGAPQNTPVSVTLDEFRAGTPIPEWLPYLYGEPLADVINRCEEITGKPRVDSAGEKPAMTFEDLESAHSGSALKSDGTPNNPNDPIPW